MVTAMVAGPQGGRGLVEHPQFGGEAVRAGQLGDHAAQVVKLSAAAGEQLAASSGELRGRGAGAAVPGGEPLGGQRIRIGDLQVGLARNADDHGGLHPRA